MLKFYSYTKWGVIFVITFITLYLNQMPIIFGIKRQFIFCITLLKTYIYLHSTTILEINERSESSGATFE
mgnify:CR=1 FL=1